MDADVAQMDAVLRERARLNDLSETVIGAALRVSTGLGHGSLEKVYENALFQELTRRGLRVEQQVPIHVLFEGSVVGVYVPDLLVAGSLIVEIKAGQSADKIHRQQCLNYLRATNLKLGLVLNFGCPRLGIARVVCNF